MLRMTLLALTIALAASFDARAQSFNCAYARQADEQAICSSYDLRQLDSQMSSIFYRLKSSLDYNSALRLTGDQASWLADGNSCGYDETCIRAAYRRRIAQLLSGY